MDGHLSSGVALKRGVGDGLGRDDDRWEHVTGTYSKRTLTPLVEILNDDLEVLTAARRPRENHESEPRRRKGRNGRMSLASLYS